MVVYTSIKMSKMSKFFSVTAITNELCLKVLGLDIRIHNHFWTLSRNTGYIIHRDLHFRTVIVPSDDYYRDHWLIQ